jgi:UDP:flavonoid glycosyltransferase YjiC (YdhE family)
LGRALLAWEFGGDLGHARRAVAVGRQLRALGHEMAFVSSDLAALEAADAAELECLPTPVLPLSPHPDPSPLNASDVLLNLGYGDARALAGALAAWRSLVRLLRPDAIVCDYAPTALLAAREHGLPCAALGSGFSIPPVADPMPSLRPWATVDSRALVDRDAKLLATVREAWAAIGARKPAPASAGEVFRADAQLVCAWPELDHFGARGDVEYLGPQRDGAAAQPIAWATEARPRLFAYLKPRDPRFARVIEAIARHAGEAIVAAPGLPDARALELSAGPVRVVTRAVDTESLAGADLWMSHAGAGSVATAMRLGVPQALLPLHLEQYLVARRAASLGIAAVREPESTADLGEWLGAALGDEALKRAAVAARAEIAPRVPLDAGSRIARLLPG